MNVFSASSLIRIGHRLLGLSLFFQVSNVLALVKKCPNRVVLSPMTSTMALHGSPSICSGGIGLLKSVHSQQSSHFATGVDTSRGSFDWLAAAGIAWETASKDVQEKEVEDKSTLEYIERLWRNFGTFFDSGIVADREAWLDRINRACTGAKGQHSLVLGGVSVGSLRSCRILQINTTNSLVRAQILWFYTPTVASVAANRIEGLQRPSPN